MPHLPISELLMYLPCQRSLQSLSPHTVDGQFVWRTGWEGENIIDLVYVDLWDLVYVDLWLHLELVVSRS